MANLTEKVKRSPVLEPDAFAEWLPACCLPANREVARLWGACLLFGGSLWLFSNLGILALMLNLLWPLLLIGFGLYYLRWASTPDTEENDQIIAEAEEEVET